ncbi:MAG: ribonuclease H-like domain-containing protein, partial [Pseudomonadales bacterium]|nr:ribonuclease H-like domain-containing protein [Pseudomonadales bacterium]
PYDSNAFDFVWSDGAREMDYQTLLVFLEKVDHYRRQYPDIILAHFANFEVAQIKSYAVRYGMELDERVCWLLGENSPLFDLLEVVRRSLVLPLKSYGLKPICKSPHLVNFQWELEESGSQWSVVRYIDYLHESSEQKRLSIKQEILSYNRDDVKATHALEAWLRAFPRNCGSE